MATSGRTGPTRSSIATRTHTSVSCRWTAPGFATISPAATGAPDISFIGPYAFVGWDLHSHVVYRSADGHVRDLVLNVQWVATDPTQVAGGPGIVLHASVPSNGPRASCGILSAASRQGTSSHRSTKTSIRECCRRRRFFSGLEESPRDREASAAPFICLELLMEAFPRDAAGADDDNRDVAQRRYPQAAPSESPTRPSSASSRRARSRRPGEPDRNWFRASMPLLADTTAKPSPSRKSEIPSSIAKSSSTSSTLVAASGGESSIVVRGAVASVTRIPPVVLAYRRCAYNALATSCMDLGRRSGSFSSICTSRCPSHSGRFRAARGGRGWRAESVGDDQFADTRGDERRLGGQHLEEDAAERVDVGSMIDCLCSCALLRGHVLGCPQQHPAHRRASDRVGCQELRDPEIEHFHRRGGIAAIADQEIGSPV